MEIVKTLIVNAKIAIALASVIFFSYGWSLDDSILPIIGVILLPIGLLLSLVSIAISLRERFKSMPQSENWKLATRCAILHGLSLPLFILYAVIGIIALEQNMNRATRSFSPMLLRVAEARNLGDSGGPPVSVIVGYSLTPFLSLAGVLNTEVFNENCYTTPKMTWQGMDELLIHVENCPEKETYKRNFGGIVVSVVKD